MPRALLVLPELASRDAHAWNSRALESAICWFFRVLNVSRASSSLCALRSEDRGACEKGDLPSLVVLACVRACVRA
eukprot:187347-Pelagomonas_calceolata.AAC.1